MITKLYNYISIAENWYQQERDIQEQKHHFLQAASFSPR